MEMHSDPPSKRTDCPAVSTFQGLQLQERAPLESSEVTPVLPGDAGILLCTRTPEPE